MNAPCNKPTRKLDAGNPHVRFDEGEGSYRTLSTLHLCCCRTGENLDEASYNKLALMGFQPWVLATQ